MTSNLDSQTDPSPAEFWVNKVSLLALWAIAVVGAFTLHDAFSTYVFEDAYITYRYAANVAEGAGYVFTPGERVFGATAPLHTMLLALFGVLGADIPLSSGVLFATCLGAVAVIGGFILRHLRSPNASLLFALLIMAGSTDVYTYWGLETPLLTALVLGSILAVLKGRDDLAGVLAGVAFLTRYDAAVFAILLFVGLLVHRRKMPWRPGIIATLIVTPWLLFAWLYFGSVLPNTLHAKMGETTILRYLHDSAFTQLSLIWEPLKFQSNAFLGSKNLHLALNIGLGLAVLVACVRLVRKQHLLGLLVIYPLGLWAGYAVVGPPLAFRWYMIPATVSVLVIAFAGFGALLPEARFRWSRLIVTLALAGFCMSEVPASQHRTCARYLNKTQYVARVVAYGDIADWIIERELTDLTLITLEPGYLTYKTRNPAIDAAGLVTKNVYFHGDRSKRTSIASLISARKPELVVSRHPWWRKGYVLAYSALPGTDLFLDTASHEERYDELLLGFEALDSSPNSDVALRHPFDLRVDRMSTKRWGKLGGRENYVGRPRPLQVDGARVTEKVLTIDRSISGAETPPFLIDFDRLSFRFTGTDPQSTYVQLLIGGKVVFESAGRKGKGAREFLANSWPVGLWRGRTAQLRFAIGGKPKQWLSVGPIRSVMSANALVLDDFDGPDGYGARWSTTFGKVPADLEPVARSLGVEFAYSPKAAISLGLAGKQAQISEPFRIRRDLLCFLVMDFCPEGRSLVQLLVDGEVVRSFSPQGSGRIRAVTWDVRELRRKGAVLKVYDLDEDPENWIGIDHIIMTDE